MGCAGSTHAPLARVNEEAIPFRVRALRSALVPEAVRKRLEATSIDDAGNGYDVFGAHRAGAALGHALTKPLYDNWFRVTSKGFEHIPHDGPVIVAANHSGTLPFDAMMLYADLLRHTQRLPRAIADRFVAGLPWVGLAFSRAGVVGGSRRNMERLLDRGELVLVHPEGVPGISKRFSERYQLQPWRIGHAELAIRFAAAIIPAAIVGAEEQMPQIARLPIRIFGAPFLPIAATPFPLPVRYSIRYGAPIRFDHPRDAADDPQIVRAAAARVALEVQRLIDQSLAERNGIFR